MKKQTRRIIFYGMVLAFFAATPLLVLYALGYSINFASGSLTPTGGFFIKANVTNFTVSVNGRSVKETGYFSRGTLVDGLPPGEVTIEIAKSGYQTWKKTVLIETQTIQEIRSVLLVPETLTLSPVLGTTTVYYSPGPVFASVSKGKAAFIRRDSKGAESVILFDSSGSRAAGESVSLPIGFRSKKGVWNENETLLLIEGLKGGLAAWEIISPLGKSEPLFSANSIFALPASTTFPVRNVKEVFWSGDQDSFFLFAESSIFRWNRKTNTAAKLVAEVRTFAPTVNGLAFVNTSGFLAVADNSGGNISTIGRPGFYLDKPSIWYNLDSEGIIALLDGAGGVYFGDPAEKKITAFRGNFLTAEFSKDSNLLGLFGKETFARIFLRDEPRQPFRKRFTEETVFSTREEVLDFLWFGKDRTHAVYSTPKGVFLAETETRFGPPMIIRLVNGTFRLAPDPQNKSSFFLFDGNLLQRIEIPE